MLNLILIVLTSLIALHLMVSTVKMIRGNKDKIYSRAHIFAFTYFLAELFRCKVYLYFTSSLADTDIYNIFTIGYFIVLAFDVITDDDNIQNVGNFAWLGLIMFMQRRWSFGYNEITAYGSFLCIALYLFVLCYHEINNWRKSAKLPKSPEKKQLGMESGSK